MSTSLSDMAAAGISSCCSAKVYFQDICAECKEHCTAIVEEEPVVCPDCYGYNGWHNRESCLQ